MKKKLLTMLLAVAMAATGTVPSIQVQAQEALEVQTMEKSTADSGQCGDNVYWILDEVGTLTISGSGEMWDYDNNTPFFEGCSAEKVLIKEGVTSIGDHAFSGSILSSIEIPEGVTSIGFEAFFGCRGLTTISIPKSVISIKSNTFMNCGSLTSVDILGSLTSIESGAFCNCESLTSVNIHRSVTSIGDYAFQACGSLTSLWGLNNATYIGDYAFAGCTSLSSVGDLSNATYIGNYAFHFCEKLNGVGSLSKVTEIGESAFLGCISLSSVGSLENVTKIGDCAFSSCEKLSSVGSLENVTRIGRSAFFGCASLNIVGDLRNATYIGGTAFFNCTSLRSVGSLKNVTEIGESAFLGCISLSSVGSLEKVTKIGDYVFANCEKLSSVGSLEKVTKIGGYAFYDCISLRSVGSLKNVTQIGEYAFFGCINLSSVGSLKKVTKIGEHAFACCANLSSVELENVTSIGYEAFCTCISLSSVGDLRNVTELGRYAFSACSSLSSITVPREVFGSLAYGEEFHYTSGTGYWLESIHHIPSFTTGNGTEVKVIPDGHIPPYGAYVWYDEDETEHYGIKIYFIGSAISSKEPEKESQNDIKLHVYDTGDGVESPKALEGTAVKVEGFGTVFTDENGRAVIVNKLTGSQVRNAKISVTQPGYREYYFYRDIYSQDTNLLWNDNTEYIMMKRLQDGDNSNPYVSTLMCYAPGKKLQNGMITQVSGNVKIQMNAVWHGKMPSTYTLYQKNGKNSYTSRDGIFNLNIDEAFEADRPIYAVLEAADGTTVEEKTALMPGEDGLEEEAVDLIDTESTGTLGEDKPFLSGHELAVDLKKATITVSIEGDRIRAAIGPKGVEEEFFSNKNWAEWKKLCEEQASGKTLSEVSDLINNNLPMKWTRAWGGSADIYGFMEGRIPKSGDAVIAGGVTVTASMNVGVKSQYVVGVVPCYLKVSLGMDGAVNGTFAYNWTQKKIDMGQTGIFFEVEPALAAEGGVGVVDVLSVGVEGRGSLPFSHKFGSPDSELSLKGQLSLKAKLLIFEYTKVFAEKEWQLLPQEGTRMGTARMSLPGLDDFEVLDAGYLQKESLWLGCNNAQAFSLEHTGAGSVEKILKTNINPDADMQIVDVGGTEMILWTEGDAARSAINNSKLVYTIYDEEKRTWSEPVAVADDGTADFAPTVVSDGEHVYVAWQNISREFEDNAALSDYAAASIIAMSTWTAGEGFSKAVTVSQEGGMAAAPKVALNAEGSPYVAYLQNTKSDPLLMSGNNNILYSVMKGDNVEHKTFVQNAGLVTTISTAYTNDYEVSYTLDADGDLSTLDDREIVTKGTKDAATKNSTMDSGVKYIRNGGKDFRFWYQEDAIVMSDAGGKETIVYQDESGALTDDFRVISGKEGQLALIWTAVDENGNKQIEGSLYDAAENKWSKAIQISDTDADVYSPEGIFTEDGSLQLLYKKTGDDGTDLCVLMAEPSVNLTVENAYADETAFVPGKMAKVRVQVKNNGTEKANSYTIDIDGTKTTIKTALAPGESAVVEADYMVPEDFTQREISVLAEANQVGRQSRSGDNAGNEFLLTVGYPDLTINLTDHKYEFGQLMEIRVANENCVDTEATLEIRKGSRDGELVKTIALGKISKGEAVTVSYLWNAESENYSDDAEALYFDVVSEKPEQYTSNNYDFVIAAKDTRSVEPPVEEEKPPVEVDPPVKEAVLTELSAVKAKTEYNVGDVLNTDDLTVTAKYSDGTSKAVTNYATDASKIDMGIPGTKTLKVTYQEKDVTLEFPIAIQVKEEQEEGKNISITGAKVTLAAASCAYTGKVQKPKVTSVTVGETKLESGRDYTVSYKNNKNIGKASVIITGKGDYTGEAKKTFSIKAKKGSKFTVGAYKYIIVNNSEAAFLGIKSAKTKKVVIPKTVKIGGKNFKITSIAARALKNKKVTSVSVGANVKTIGAEAYRNCKKLGTVNIKSSKLKTVGKNAFKGIKSTAQIRVPSKKLSAYKKLLKGKGQGKKVKIVKI